MYPPWFGPLHFQKIRETLPLFLPSWREIVGYLQWEEPHDLDWGLQLQLLTLLKGVIFFS